jgi:hypothetical protein
MSFLILFGINILANNRSNLLLFPKATKGVTCPAVNPDSATCSTDQADVLTKVSAWIADDAEQKKAFEDAVDKYLSSCKASQCQSACSALITLSGLDLAQTAAAGFGSSFTNDCTVPDAIKTSQPVCTGTPADGQTCTTLYNDVIAEAGKSPWSGQNIKTKVDSFITTCVLSSCGTACKTVISGVDLSSSYSSFATTFKTNCNPEQSTDDDATSDGDADNEDKKGDNGLWTIKPNVSLFIVLMTSCLLHFVIFW